MTTGLILALIATGIAARTATSQVKRDGRSVCVTICNHWSYIGIGWQLGIESCALAVQDAMAVADKEPHLRTCLEMDARSYEFMAEKYPEVTAKLKKYLAAGKLELIGGTYSQPMGTTIGGESNIRQIVMGRELIRKALGYDVTTFLEEEEFSHPQLPQLVVGAGYKYASLAQIDSWGKAGVPYVDFNVVNWKGLDGTTVRSTTRNALFGNSLNGPDLTESEAFKKLSSQGKPLVTTWQEFGWESPDHPSADWVPGQYIESAKRFPTEYVTMTQYLDRYGSHPKETVFFPMEAFNKRLTWGIGGDQVRILDRKLEGILQAAETFDAFASTLGRRAQVGALDQAWKDMLTAQSHDVGLCEYSRWQGPDNNRFGAVDRVEDHHSFTWGSMGYIHMDSAKVAGEKVLNGSLQYIAAKVEPSNVHADRTVTVFNPLAWDRSSVATTGRLYPLPAGTKDIEVVDRGGRRLPSQLVVEERDSNGNLTVANAAFMADHVPSVGYSTYGLRFSKAPLAPAPTALKVDEKALTVENPYLRIAFDADTGAVKSLIDKSSGKEMLQPKDGQFPVLRGRPNASYPLHGDIPQILDSSTSKAAELGWAERGPVRATLRALHLWHWFKFETRISLTAESRAVEVASRFISQVPPQSNADPNDYKEGYWLAFAPSGESKEWVRDYPLGVESTKRSGFHALTFVDRVSSNGGLLVLHDGTQWFQVDEDGLVKNLLQREWESNYTFEYGFPHYSEYHHALLPHSAALTNVDRLHASSEFTRPFLTVVSKPGNGSLPLRHSFLAVSGAGVQVLAFRKKAGPGFEFRVVESEGRSGEVTAVLRLKAGTACQTDLLGRRLAEAHWKKCALRFNLPPWKVMTFELK